MAPVNDPRPAAAARLTIHTAGECAAARGLFAFLTRKPRARAPLGLHIDDAQGLRVLALDDAGPKVEVVLPAGTYRVSVQQGEMRRSYTMTLGAGASSDLQLRFPIADDHSAAASALAPSRPARKP
ncbi:MAG: hypothetical protein ABI423_11460 [Burkholderiales bacterium]